MNIPSSIIDIKKKPIFGLLILLFVGVIIYANILNAPFHFDDYDLMLGNPLIKNLPHLMQQWKSCCGRKFVTFATFAINYRICKDNPFGYHLVNVILHITNAFLLYYVILKLFSTPVLSKTALSRQKTLFSLFASLIFLSHPLQTQAVTYIWQRSEVLSGFFYLLSYLFYLKGRLESDKRYYFACVAVFFIGFFAKGTVVTVPLVILLTEYSFIDPEKSKRVFVRIRPYLLFSVLFGIVAYTTGIVHMIRRTPLALVVLDPTEFSSQYLFTQIRVVMRYIQLAFIPINQNVDYYFPLSKSFFNLPVILSFMALVVVLVFAVRIFKKHRMMSFGIFWFFIYLLPTSLKGLMDPIWEHRTYISIAGFSMFFVSLLFYFISKKKIRNAVIVGVLIVLSALTISRNILWRSPIKLMEDTVKKSPLNARAITFLGTLYYKEGKMKKAFELLTRAVALNPNIPEAYNNLGLIYKRIGKIEDAELMFERSIEVQKRSVDPYVHLAYIAMARGDYELAEQRLNETLKFVSTEKAYIGLGDLCLARGGFDKAKVFFERALEINPNSQRAYYGLGNVYSLKMDYRKALSMYREAVVIDSRFVDAYINMGVAYYTMRDFENALIMLEQARAIDARRPDIHRHLAQVHYALKEADREASNDK